MYDFNILRTVSQVATYQVHASTSCLAVMCSLADAASTTLATATVKSEVHLHRAFFDLDENRCTDPAGKAGTSAKLSTYQVSTMTFHPFRPELLVATMDGSIHFLSTTADSPCTSIQVVQLSTLVLSELRAVTMIHRPSQSTRCAMSKDGVCIHAASTRATHQAAMSGMPMQQIPSHFSAAENRTLEAVESIQHVLELCFFPLDDDPPCAGSTGPASENPSPESSFEHSSRCASQYRHLLTLQPSVCAEQHSRLHQHLD